MIILGAGMAGCIAGIVNGESRIYEGAPDRDSTVSHTALLRFSDDSVSKAVGIPFKKVSVQKSICMYGAHLTPNPQLSNLYSAKVTGGHYGRRSIMNIDSDVRYIAPIDFHEQMLLMLGNRVLYDNKIESLDFVGTSPVVSTLPLFVNTRLTGIDGGQIVFNSSSISVTRYTIADCDAYFTVYFPGDETPVYRASLTGDTLIVEAAEKIGVGHIGYILKCLGLNKCTKTLVADNAIQRLGKIVPIADKKRKQMMYDMTHNHNLYSLGRFATWRSIQLTDVLNDVYVINRMINTDAYDRLKG